MTAIQEKPAPLRLHEASSRYLLLELLIFNNPGMEIAFGTAVEAGQFMAHIRKRVYESGMYLRGSGLTKDGVKKHLVSIHPFVDKAY